MPGPGVGAWSWGVPGPGGCLPGPGGACLVPGEVPGPGGVVSQHVLRQNLPPP